MFKITSKLQKEQLQCSQCWPQSFDTNHKVTKDARESFCLTNLMSKKIPLDTWWNKSNCLGGRFGKKWTDVGTSIQVPTKVHFFTNGTIKQFLSSFSNLLSDWAFFLPYSEFSLQPVHSTSNGPALSKSECVIYVIDAF